MIQLLAPGLVGVLVAAGLGAFHLPATPRRTLLFLTFTAVIAASTFTIMVAIVAAGFLLGPVRSQTILDWCRVIPLHHRVGFTPGIIATITLGLITARFVQVLRSRRLILSEDPGQRIRIVATDKPLAYSTPAGGGCVVVSTGLLAPLTPRQRQVVFAHEQAHLQERHHRFLTAAALSHALLPALAPLVHQIRHATERGADERAATAMGGDRQLVATTIARAALQTSSFDAVIPAFGGGSVTGRVQALLNQPRPRVVFLSGVLAATGLGVALLSVSIQFHHFYDLLNHVCRGIT